MMRPGRMVHHPTHQECALKLSQDIHKVRENEATQMLKTSLKRAITSELICLPRQADGWLFEALKWVEVARKGQRIVFLRPSGELMARKK